MQGTRQGEEFFRILKDGSGQRRGETIKKFEEDDVGVVEDFYGRISNRNTTHKIQAFRWIQKNPNLNKEGSNYLLLFIMGRLVGYWGFMPMQFFCFGQRMMLSFIQEALIDPALRNQGLGHTLLKEGLRLFDSFMCSVWHNEFILAIIKKCGWSNLGAFRPLKKVFTVRGAISTRWRKETFRKLPSLLQRIYQTSTVTKPNNSRCTIEIVESCGDEFDLFFWTTTRKLGVISERTSRILNWRYLDVPYKKYTLLAARQQGQLCAYLVLRIDSQPRATKGIIVDLLADPDHPQGLEDLVEESDRIFSLAGVDFSVCLVQQDAFRQILMQRGYFVSDARTTDTFWTYSKHSVTEFVRASDLRLWYITYGDSDGDMW